MPGCSLNNMQSDNTNVSNRSARKSGEKNNKANRRERVYNGEEYRTQRRELWFTIDGQKSGSYRFDKSHFPVWFKQVSSLYEKFKFNRIRLHFETGYPSTAQGQIFCSYNTGFYDTISTDPVIIAAQRGAMSGPVYRGYAIIIPKSAYSETPSRRPCRGTDEETYIFDAVYAITGDQLTGSFSVYIDYDVTFYTPQLSGAEEYVSFYANSPRADPQAVLKGGAQIKRQGVDGFVVNFARSFSNVLAQVAVNAVDKLASQALRVETYNKDGISNGLLQYITENPGTSQAKTTVTGQSTALTSAAEVIGSDSTNVTYGSVNSFVQIPDGGTARALNQTISFQAPDISSLRIFTDTAAPGGPSVFASIFGY